MQILLGGTPVNPSLLWFYSQRLRFCMLLVPFIEGFPKKSKFGHGSRPQEFIFLVQILLGGGSGANGPNRAAGPTLMRVKNMC